MIVTPSADFDLALPAIVFSAVGTAGQRCTSLRRLIAHESIAADLVARLKKTYDTLTIGDPLDPNIPGRAADRRTRRGMQAALAAAKKDGGTIHGGARVLAENIRSLLRHARHRGNESADRYRAPGNLRADPLRAHLSHADEAIALHNDVPQGLSSSIFTTDMREAEAFLSSRGSDCGIANVNIGPAAPRSAARSEARRTRAAGANPAPTPGRPICGANQHHQLLIQMPLAQGVTFDF